MLISTSSDEGFRIGSVCRYCEITIENIVLKVGLNLFELDELYVILGMDFLTKYHTVLDSSNKEVVLKESRKFEVKLVGDKRVELASIIFVLKARKLTKKRTLPILLM